MDVALSRIVDRKRDEWGPTPLSGRAEPMFAAVARATAQVGRVGSAGCGGRSAYSASFMLVAMAAILSKPESSHRFRGKSG
jgi:hypothetical protein